VLKGKLATGESLEVHETTLPPGGMPTRHTITCIPKCGSFEKEPWSSPSMEPATGFGPGSVGSCIRMTNTASKMWVQRRQPILSWPSAQARHEKRGDCIIEKIGAPSSRRRPRASSFVFGGQKKIFAAS